MASDTTMAATILSAPARRWIGRAALLAIAIAIAGAALRNVLLGTPVVAHEVLRSDLVQTVVASGRIMTPQRVSVGVVTTGRVSRIPVEEGQRVSRDQVLIVLNDEDERAALAQARAAVAQAETKLAQLREVGLPAAEQAFIQAEANAVNARRQHERSRDLKERGFVSQSALDDTQRNLDVAESQLRAARLQVETNRPAGSDFRLALTQLEQARANEGVAQARVNETIVKAAVDGVLIARNVEVGDVVQPGKELMVLAPSGETQIVLQIDERNLGQLKVGQKALVSADAFPRERFNAELFYINPGIDALRGSVEIKLRVANPPDYLRQDMTVSADIEVGRSAATVVVPAGAVRDLNSEQPWVLAIDGRRARRHAVRLGLKGNGVVEVLEGVAPGTRLIAASESRIGNGDRVRARTAEQAEGK